MIYGYIHKTQGMCDIYIILRGLTVFLMYYLQFLILFAPFCKSIRLSIITKTLFNLYKISYSFLFLLLF